MDTMILGESEEERARSARLSFLYAGDTKEGAEKGPRLICGICGSRDNFSWGLQDQMIFLVCESCGSPSVFLNISELEIGEP